ncbi:2OG-Fe(II) oxygenase [Falsiroseomonas oryzae]|uniref:2OG-Fe(II) oxygenase n=1 Tax=Falsiroseomonas oryzae TaxID=2766473 RepID=UPI0022EAB167|nr:2OG-Fe(II) oxygenase [Roseomonas sp. MO-31]
MSAATQAMEGRVPPVFDSEIARMIPFARLVADRHAIAARYRAASPYPHVVLDDLFDPGVLDRVAADFPGEVTPAGWVKYDTANEIKRTSRGLIGVPAYANAFLWQLCSEPFLAWLREVTGIEDLVADPMFHGGGMHESFRGGWLNIHADWTQHPHLPLLRRLNLIVYLNRDWDEDWGGALELWAPGATAAGARVAPLFNRAVLFPTTAETLHGFPDAMRCPPDRSRRSVSVFYWSPDPDAVKRGAPITFLPGRRSTRLKAFARSLVPPIAFSLRDGLRNALRGGRREA